MLPAGRSLGAKDAALEAGCPKCIKRGVREEQAKSKDPQGHAKSRLRMETMAGRHRDVPRLLSDGILMLGNKSTGGKPLGVPQGELHACMARSVRDGASGAARRQRGGMGFWVLCWPQAGERISVQV